MSADPLVASLPKVELHLHLVGAASPDIIAGLARRHPDVGLPTDPLGVRRWLRFTNFAEFGAAYSKVTRLLSAGEEVVALVTTMAAGLAVDKVRYAEVSVTPLAHLACGLAPEELRDALNAGRRAAAVDAGVELAWIFDVDGELGPDAARAALRWVVGHAPDGTVGFGLGGPEPGCARAAFKSVFDEAIAAGLHSVPHAGETDGPESVWAALHDLRAERIGHGIRSIDDPALMEHLAAHAVPLEVCPTSNACTGAAPIATNPLPDLAAADVPIIVGTDDPGLFGTTLAEEYRLCHDAFGFRPAQLVDVVRTSIDAAFCSPTLKRRLLEELRSVEA